ncbi:MAG TPA: isoleucine--tRNA ligase [Chitinophagales bacterium]|nr:isoleucine--tRNA ligase [Chitinophagales bacterium]
MNRKNPNSKGYPEFDQLNMPAIEKEILKWWAENDIFKKSISTRPDDKRFVFYEGPPSANGKPGIHHVMGRTIKDLFCRFKTLQGYRVERKAGWDTHGLPVELNVEKQLGITKADIGKTITVEEYNRLCREDVMKFTDIWRDLTDKMGYWVDMDNPYVTYENNYIESLWTLIKMLYEKGLLYEGYTIQPYSPAAGTGLSSAELNQPGCYRNVKDTSAIAQFKIKEPKFDVEGDVFFLAWTTTPWTLPSNTALAVGKNIDYVLVKTFNPFTHQPAHVILAKDLAGKYFAAENADLSFDDYKKGDKKIPFAIIKTIKGADLEGIRYEQLLPYTQPTDGDAFRVLLGDFVTTTDGTGIVHIAPSFGADDFRVAKQNGIGSLTLVDKQGKFVDEVNDPIFPLERRFVKDGYYTEADLEHDFVLQKEILRVNNVIPDLKNHMSVDELIVLKLKLENKLFKTEKYEHNYPHCWRTDKPVIYYPLDSWFIKTTAVKDRLIELNKTINWKPAHTGEGRFGQWLENLVDWNLSRSRFWGTPLPIWVSEDGSEQICIGSIEELKAEAAKAVAAGVAQPVDITDLHKPYIDEVILVSPTGKPMKRVSDLIDVWFDSGAMPYAQWHYPFENIEQFKKNFPADYIAEGVDQTRGWFFTLHVLAVALFDSVAYKNVVSNGLLLDKAGNKMSKRLGNIIDPFETLEKYSADATRWYMMRNSDPWDNMKFDMNGLQESMRSHFGTLYNTYGFFALYANIDNWVIDEQNIVPIEKRPELDRWIISKLQSLVKDVTAQLEDYEPTKAARSIEKFVDEDLSNWYVRLNRRRFWKGEMSEDKKAAYETLYECLNVVGQLMSPVSPFFSEWLYQNLTGNIREAAVKNNTPLKWESVHISYLTVADEKLIDKDLEERMELAQKACSLILSLRKKEKIKVRQPLSKILIPVLSEKMQQQFSKVESYILSEVNVKGIEYISDASGVVKKKIKLNFKELGKRAGTKMKALQQALIAFTTEDISKIERDQKYSLSLDGETFELLLSDVEIQTEDIPGWLVASEGGLTVALDVTITDELKHEGNAREFVNKVQNLRKDKDFQVLDRIKVSVVRNPMLESTLLQFKDYIANEILAREIVLVDSLSEFDEVELNEEVLKVKVELN